MPTIRVDDDVYGWLESLARPFKDTPNSVLRRVAGIDGGLETDSPTMPSSNSGHSASDHTYNGRSDAAQRPINAKRLTKEWGVQVDHALYHKDGTFFENLRRFPGALCDPHGCVVFHTEKQYRESPYLDIGQKLNVRDGISKIPEYRRYCKSDCFCRIA